MKTIVDRAVAVDIRTVASDNGRDNSSDDEEQRVYAVYNQLLHKHQRHDTKFIRQYMTICDEKLL